MSTPVTAQYLLEGAAYSLERCGQLLCDARLLYLSGSYATAVALALFAREELGRSHILLDFRQDVVGGKKVTIKEIRDRCEVHLVKQEAAMASLTMRAETGSGLGNLLRTRSAAAAEPASKEFRETSEQLEEIDRKLKNRTPDDRGKLRVSALYVDPAEGGWKRPTTAITKKRAYEVITDASNDLRGRGQRYIMPELYKDDDPELFSALTGWADRPQLTFPDHLPLFVEDESAS
jgi:AbiV family abortive infection protein